MATATVLLLLALTGAAEGFVAAPFAAVRHARGLHVMQASAGEGEGVLARFGSVTGRRAFVVELAAVGGLLALPLGALADMEDLSSTDEDPQATVKLSSKDEEQERIRRKLEAQAKATGKTTSGRRTYKESVEGELEKQKAQKKDKAKRREDLCEELGRGC